MVSKIAKNSIQIYSLAPILKNPIFLLLISNLRSFLSNARPPGQIPMKGRSGWGRWMSNGGLGGSLFVGAVELYECWRPTLLGSPMGILPSRFAYFLRPDSQTRNPRNGPRRMANFLGTFRGHVGMTCHETCHETYEMVRFKSCRPICLLKRTANLVRFVAWHPHMPSKRTKKIGHTSWTVSWISRFRI